MGMLAEPTVPKRLRWHSTQYSPLKRQLEIFRVAVQFLGYLAWERFLGKNTPSQRHRRAKWLVGKLLDLGPTFIKIGQSLSTRVDLLPLEYIQELTQLQDSVPAFSGEQAIAVIEVEFGKSISALFREFELVPLAAASLGQVHRATLYTGETVAVKVQRPGLEGILNLDFEVLHRLIRFSKRYLPGVRKFDLEAIYQEFFELLFQEIDYIHEGKNADRFRENFCKTPRVCVPKIYWQYTTRRVLTLEYLPGIKVSDRASLEAEGINVDSIVQLGICSYLKQLLEDGFFQSDPHPGNMAVNGAGELIFYDFGTMAEIKAMSKERMVQTFFAILRKDTDKLVETLIYLGLIEPIADLGTVKRIVAFMLEEFRDKPVDVTAFEAISDEVYLMFKQQPFRLPPEMTFIIKSLTTLDGIARALDPQYNLLAASQPFFKNLAVSEGKGELMGALAKQARNFFQKTWQRPDKFERSLQQLEGKIERGELQLRVRSLENERILKRIHQAIKCLTYACLTGFTLLSAAILLASAYPKLAIIFFSLSGLCCLFFLRSLIVLTIQEK
jgi:predicted unusual protein kinase regulating ubiquinone biosynthesis (AarF/ABC1/UbiB family)